MKPSPKSWTLSAISRGEENTPIASPPQSEIAASLKKLSPRNPRIFNHLRVFSIQGGKNVLYEAHKFRFIALMTATQYTAAQIANMDHLNPKNILRAFNPEMSGQELMERAALMQEVRCTRSKIAAIKSRWSK